MNNTNKYEIKISGAKEENGTVNLFRLVNLAECIHKVAEGSLQIRLKGISLTKGRKSISLKEALEVDLVGLREGSTCIDLRCSKFSETLKGFQMDVFKQDSQRDLPEKTPMSLFIESYHAAISGKETELLDKSLLKELKNLNKAFLSDTETFTIKNQGSVEELVLKKETIKKIITLEEELPEPQSVIMNGIVELLQFSKQKVNIQTEEGMVVGFIGENLSTDDLAAYFGKKITIAGTIHYKPGGKSVVEITRIFDPKEGDEYFAKKPVLKTVEEQIQIKLKSAKHKNYLGEVVGKWPGDESFEDLLKMLSK